MTELQNVERPLGRLAFVVLLCFLGLSSPLSAADRFAVVITGASAGQAYAEKYDRWRTSFVATLTQTFKYPDDHVFVLAEHEDAGVLTATRDNVRRVFGGLRVRTTADDLLLVVLIGHGTTGDGDEAKFNLVGPDLKASEWAEILKPVPARLVFVNTSGGSFPFLRRLMGPGRVVVTATDTPAQQFETIFPEFFLRAFGDPAADDDKNGRVSLWEAFSFASAGVKRWFDQHGQLPTERPLLDDNGDGLGREAQAPGTDGALARSVYLSPEPQASGDPLLVSRLAALHRELDELRARKGASGTPDQFDADIERLLAEIARVSRQLKQDR